MEYLCCADRKPASRTELPLCSSSGRFATLCRPSRCIGLARISHTLAGAGSVLAAPRAFRALPIQPVSAAARKPLGTTMPFAIIPQWYEKCGLVAAAVRAHSGRELDPVKRNAGGLQQDRRRATMRVREAIGDRHAIRQLAHHAR